MAEGILNHDIFLFVPNISTEALPWQKYQQNNSFGPNLFIQFTKQKSNILNIKCPIIHKQIFVPENLSHF